ncbi:MAG: thiosulfate/3-mercaptopyruvate sulfurtransferase [Vicingaceae bacterium]
MGNFEAKFQPQFLTDFQGVKLNVETNTALVVDARSALRFLGEAPEPREGLRSGNIPNSCNLHYASLLDKCKYKSKELLQQLFEPFENEKELIFSCGSGITACILYLAASELIQAKLSVYDGSWTEWGSR